MWNDPLFFRHLLENLYDGVYFVDRDRIITYWNKGAERLSGYSAEEVIGHGCRHNLLVHVDGEGRQLCMEGCPVAATIEDGLERQAEVFMHHRNGHRVPVQVRVTPIRDAQNEITGAVEIFSDNSTRASDQNRIAELQQLAFLDPLTELVNRRYLEKKLETRLEEMRRYGWPVAVLFIDVDHFKLVNDNYGHNTGDDILKMVGQTLSSCSRNVDTVGRWGGEEFVVILTNASPLKASQTAERYRSMVEESALTIEGTHLQVTVSIGVAQASATDTLERLILRADASMYQSKLNGRNRVTVAE